MRLSNNLRKKISSETYSTVQLICVKVQTRNHHFSKLPFPLLFHICFCQSCHSNSNLPILSVFWTWLGISTKLMMNLDKITLLPYLKLAKIMLETWNLVCKCTHKCSFRKYTFSYETLLILLMSAFFCKKSAFFGQNSTFTQSNIVRVCYRFYSALFSFCKTKGNY